MPHIAVMMYPGRDDEIKTNLSRKIQDLVVEELKLSYSAVSVSVHDVAKEDFAKEVFDKIPEETIYAKRQK